MKIAVTMIVYLLGLMILIILYPAYNTSGNNFQIISFLIFWLTVISVLTALILSIHRFINRKYQNGIAFLSIGLSIFTIYHKLIFLSYNVFFHSIWIVILIWLFIRYRKNSEFKFVYLFTLIINVFVIFISDRFLLNYFNSNKIAWSKKEIGWEDYKDSFEKHLNERYYAFDMQGFNPENVRAITATSIKYKINELGNIPSVIVGAFFLPDESYVKEEFKTNSQLEHEKLYLDICEYHSRRIRKYFHLKMASGLDYKILFQKHDIYFSNTDSDIENAEKLIEAITHEKEEMNSKYMIETSFGQNLGEQKKWEKRIKRLLTQYEDYK